MAACPTGSESPFYDFNIDRCRAALAATADDRQASRSVGGHFHNSGHPVLHPLDHRLTEAGARHLGGALHQAGKVVGHNLVGMAFSRLTSMSAAASFQPMCTSIISAERISDPGLT